MNKVEIIIIAVVGLIAVALFFTGQALAGGKHTHPAPVVTTTSVENYSITEGVSTTDLARGVAMSGASHQFDFSTQDLQLGVTGASFDGEQALSLGVAKRFAKDSWVPNALFHGSFSTTGSSDELYTFGVTFRL
jgi:hypothetical protein